MKKIFTLCFLFAIICVKGQSQSYNMSNTPLSTCSGSYYDPAGPSTNYANNSNFTQTITPATAGNAVKIVFSSFSTEGDFDFLYIYNGNTATPANLIGKYSGTNSPGAITSTAADGSLTFKFTSDNATRAAGWAATLSCAPLTVAQTVSMNSAAVSTCSATYYDPNGVTNYDNNTDITQTITPSTAGAKLQAAFSSFSTESGYDYLYIYNGNSTSATLIGTYSGTTSPGTIISTATDGSLTFRFTSDGNTVSTGWVASLSCVVPALTYTDSWVSMSTGATTWCAGEIRNISITVKNTGTATWISGSTGVNLSYYWSNQSRDANNRILPFTTPGLGPLAPGQQQTITFPVTATSAGTYTLNFDLVKEQSCWFADNSSGCSGPGNVVYVSPSQTISQPITGLSYPTTTATYCTGTATTSNSPTVTGGIPTLYTVSPSLPAGLSINSTTGVISGTPTIATAAANYVVTASNSCGSKTATVNLTVVTSLSNLIYASASPSYCLNTAIASNTVSSITGGGIIIYSINPALPAGLNINTSTGAITGVPTAVSAPATYTVTATNGCSSATKALTITVNALPTGVSATAIPATVCAGSSVALTALPAASSTLLSQNFNSGLGSWTATNSSYGIFSDPAAAAWTIQNDGYTYGSTFHSNDNSKFIITNSDAQGPDLLEETLTRLYSPTFSTVGVTGCSLDFYQFLRNGGYLNEAQVSISVNGGSTWISLHDYVVDGTLGSSSSFVHSTLDLSAFIGYSSVQLRYEYDADYDYYWALDNITVTGVLPYTYAWTSSPAGFTAATQNTTAAPAVNTTYTVKVTNSNGCSASANAAVTVNPLPTAIIAASATTACLNGTTPSITFTGATGTAPYTFTYKINNGTNQIITSSGTSSSVTLPVSTSTVYFLHLQFGECERCQFNYL